jgi:hypothetical protein
MCKWYESTGDQIVHEKRAGEIGPATHDHEARRALRRASENRFLEVDSFAAEDAIDTPTLGLPATRRPSAERDVGTVSGHNQRQDHC